MGTSSLSLWIALAVTASGPRAELPAALRGDGRFVENLGQWPDAILFAGRAGGLRAGFRKDGIVLRGDGGGPIVLTFEDASPAVAVEGEGLQPDTFGFRVGSDRARWRDGARSWASILYRGLQDCLDLRVREGAGGLEYDLLLASGGDVSALSVRCEGIDGIEIDDRSGGSLLLVSQRGVLEQLPPLAWQDLPTGERVSVACRYRLLGGDRFGFETGPLDPGAPLVVDPVLVWSSYLGGSRKDGVLDVARGRDGAIVAVGVTESDDFQGAAEGRIASGWDAFVCRIDPEGSWCHTLFLGGAGFDRAAAVAVDPAGRIVVGGGTSSDDFPFPAGGAGFQSARVGGLDGFVVWIDPAADTGGTVVDGTYLGGGGEDSVSDLEVDAAGSVYLCGIVGLPPPGTPDFPTTPGAFDGDYNGGAFDVFLARIDPARPSAERLVYSTLIGGSGSDAIDYPDMLSQRTACQQLALDPATGIVTLVGQTFSADFPRWGAFQATGDTANSAAYILRLLPDPGLPPSDQLRYATYLGTSGGPVAVLDGGDGLVTVAGFTWSTTFPVTPGAFQRAIRGASINNDGFVSRLRCDPALLPDDQLVYSTYFGGSGYDGPWAMIPAGPDAVILGGCTSACDDFPLAGMGLGGGVTGAWDSYLAVLVLDGTLPPEEQLVDCAIFGGTDEPGVATWDSIQALAAMGGGRVAAAGGTNALDLPVAPGVCGSDYGGGGIDGLVAVFDVRVPTAAFTVRQDGAEVCVDGSPSSTPEGTSIVSWSWDLGDGATAEGERPDCHTYEAPGVYRVKLTVLNDLGLSRTTSEVVIVRCPAGELTPWRSVDIGTQRFPGSATRDGDCFEVCAGGAPLSGTTDRLHFVERELTGDFAITLKVEAMGAPGGAQLGLMARESLESNAATAAVSIRRSALGALAFRFDSRSASGPSIGGRSPMPAAALSGWIRLERKGTDLVGSFSTDGATWSEPEGWTQTLPGAPSVLRVGIFGIGQEPTDARSSFEALQGRACLEMVELPFARGEANGDCAVDLSDGFAILGYLFLGGSLGCLDSGDVNDDGAVDIADAISLLNYLFLGGPAPAAPYPSSGSDPTGDSMDCRSGSPCE